MEIEQEQNNKFIAWIPCLSGRLLFRHFSSGHHCATGTLLIKHEESFPTYKKRVRTVVLYEILDLKDEDDKDSDGSYHFILTGSKFSDESEFTGKIYVFPVSEGFGNKGWKQIGSDLREIKEKADRQDHIDDYYQGIIRKLSGFYHPEFYTVSFNVDECGFATLEYETVGKNGIHYDSMHIKVVSRQCFYYLKYALHKHKHHHKNDDSLTTIHEFPGSETDIGLILINDLRSSIVDIKRKFEDIDHEGLNEAQGIVSYTLSLVESSYKKGYLSQEEYNHQKNYFNNISSSLEITANQKERKRDRNANAWNTARSVLLFFISIIAPIMFLFRDHILEGIKGSENNSYIAQPFIWVFSSTVHFAAVLICVVALFAGIVAYKVGMLSKPLRSYPFYSDLISRFEKSPKYFRRLAIEIIVLALLGLAWIFVFY